MIDTRDLEKLKFPIGEFHKPENISTGEITKWIKEIELFPSRVKELTEGLSDEELDQKYKPEGWSIKQVVHHCADSHMNSFIRFKLSLTEDSPTIKPYFEDRWAEMPDYLEVPVSSSIKILEGLHLRWVKLLSSLNQSDLNKEFVHPEHGKRFSVAENIGVYAWHSNHHLEHVKLALNSPY